MTTRTISAILLTTALGLTAIGASAQVAQTPMQHDQMPHDQMMMAKGPHQALAMAYQESLAAFAKALQEQTAGAASVDVDFARDAVTEMRRSFDQMKQHHDAHMKTMTAEMHAQMATMMKQMDAHQTELNAQLTTLEQEVKAAAPDAKRVSTLAAGVTAHLTAMAKMHPTSKSTVKR